MPPVFSSAGPNGTPFDDDDTNRRFTFWRYDENEMLTLRTDQMTGPGPDGAFGTGDDLSPSYEIREYDSFYRRTKTTRYNNRGTSGFWYDGDDVIYSLERSFFDGDHEVRYVGFNGPGPDTMWGNDDDVVSWFTLSDYDANGRITERRWYSPGPDGVPDGADDTLVTKTLYAEP
jgi:hypothetical protein